MANITRRGNSFTITVTDGTNKAGKKVRHYMTWKPEKGMTDRQIENAVKKAADEFEQSILKGFEIDKKLSFEVYADTVLQDKARTGTKPRTIERYRELLCRINPAIGHMKLTAIRPSHLNALYRNLSEEGIRNSTIMATPVKDIAAAMKEKKLSLAELSRRTGIAASTLTGAKNGNPVSLKTAEAIAQELGHSVSYYFTQSQDKTPLSDKTVLEHHRLISTILSHAEKEMLIPYNPAKRATPPKVSRSSVRNVDCFQPEELEQIIDCLENESLKWRTITHLLIMTGCRRGEIAGLKWEAIDWDTNTLHIERALLYSAERGVYESTTKTGEDRYIKIPAETVKLLKEYRAYYDGLILKNGGLDGGRWKNTGYVFTKDNGEAINPDSITKWLSTFAEKYGLPNIHPHKFRHSMASLLIYNNVNIVEVSKRLGHAKTSTTTDIYSHLIKQADAEACDCIADNLLRKRA